MPPRLSAFLIVKNEARDLPACLASLKSAADEIVVVDDLSTDNTADLARALGARVFSRKLDGFGSQKQYALDQCQGQWALSIDADERVTPALAEELRRVMDSPSAKAGYEIPRSMYFLGERLRFGGVGTDHVLRFFQRTQGRYAPQQIHEKVEVQGKVGRLTGRLDHFSYATLDEYLQKIPAYTAMAAKERWNRGKRFSVWHHLRPGWELVSRVLLRGAWLDGEAGLIYAALSSHAAWLRSVALRDLERQNTPKS